jgi:AcrR family transcriptional regulator
MSSANTASEIRTDRTTARVGRPPSVNVAAIIAAAQEIGLEHVTLRQVADRLGVSLATLYRHVRSRDEMVRLAAFQITLSRALPESADAHWSELAVRYAESLFESFLAEPQLISELLRGRLGPHAEVDVLEQFLAAMSRHGFSTLEGVQLFHAIGMVTIGAAAGAIGLKASTSAGAPWGAAMQQTLAARDGSELAQVRRVLPAALDADTIPWLPTLHRLLAGIAAARGESLPAALTGSVGASQDRIDTDRPATRPEHPEERKS